MTRKCAPLFFAVLAVSALGPPKAGPAATSRTAPSDATDFSTPSGRRVRVPAEYRAAARRESDEAGAPESVLLRAAGFEEEFGPAAPDLGRGNVLVEILPWDGTGAATEGLGAFEADFRAAPGWTRVRRLPGLAYPALAGAAPGLVRVDLVTPTGLVRITSSRWTSAFDAVIRGYRDAA